MRYEGKMKVLDSCIYVHNNINSNLYEKKKVFDNYNNRTPHNI